MSSGWISEVFTSIQGEGIYAGRRQSFIRFAGCHLRCRYCDTKYAQKRASSFRFEGTRFANPVDAEFLAELTSEPEVCITGGEPMEQSDFLKDIVRYLKKRFKSIHLETNGTKPGGLKRILPYIDAVNLDFKIPSLTGRSPFWQEHERFLRACRRKDCFVKVVADRRIKLSELKRVVAIINRVDRRIPLVLQPVWGRDARELMAFQEYALNTLNDVRIIPQIHKYLNLK